MFYLKTLLRTVAWDPASQIALRDCSEEIRKEPRYIEIFWKGLRGKGLKPSAKGHMNEPSWKPICPPQTSLQMTVLTAKVLTTTF